MFRVRRGANELSLAKSAISRLATVICALVVINPLYPNVGVASATDGCVSTSQPITLRGHVRDQNVFGPPGFGESPRIDQRRVIPVLALDNPINVCPGTEDEIDTAPIYDVHVVQLIDSRGRRTPSRASVFVYGELQRGTNAFHYTPVTFIVDTPR